MNFLVSRDEDGIYYWTVDGEFLTDKEGEKIPVTGPKGPKGDAGANAITPMVRINSTTKVWEVSIDGGDTWEEMKDANGDFIQADGVQGPQGEKGEPGDKGEPGEKGETGAKGYRGLTGTTGAKGERGDAMFKSIDYTSNPNVVFFTLTAKDNTGANVVIAVPRISDISVYFADGVEVITVNPGDSLTVNFTGLTEDNFNALFAEILAEDGGHYVGVVTRVNDIEIKRPKFIDGQCSSTIIHVYAISFNASSEAMLRVTLALNDGSKYTAARVIKLTDQIP